MGRHLLLIGMMGAGKTTVGTLLAGRLGWPFSDSDHEIQRRTGKTVPEIFATEGEAAFRAQETAVLRDAAENPEPTVISVAGGAVLAEANRPLIKAAGTVVWLKADPAELARRVGDGTGRPLLDEDPEGTLRRLLVAREPVYRELADVVVDEAGLSASEVADQVLAATGLSA